MANGSAAADEIWELIKETRMDMREFRANMEDLRASQKETDRQLKETNKQLKKTDSRFNSQWGRLVESLVEGNLAALLQARGIEVRQTFPNSEVSFVKDDGRVQQKEFDIVVVNGTEAVVVEVKTLLTPDKVSYFLSALEDFKRYFPDFRHKSVYGAVAYLRSEAQAKLYAERQGLFVIRATGDSASIVNAEDFKPRAFPSEGVTS